MVFLQKRKRQMQEQNEGKAFIEVLLAWKRYNQILFWWRGLV